MNFKVRQTGLYRVSYEDILGMGLDLIGTPVSNIIITNRQLIIPSYIFCPDMTEAFGPGAYIEFRAEALDTSYTDTNIYTLQVSSVEVPHIPAFDVPPDLSLEPVSSYTVSVTTNRQNTFDEYSPSKDQWGDTTMTVDRAPKTWNFALQADDLADPGAAATLKLTVWGITDWPASPDHHMLVSINGIQVDNEIFNGHVEKSFNISIPAGTLRAGANTLGLTLPGDTGVDYDMITLDQYTLTYQRPYNAVNGSLTFTALGQLFRIANLPSQNVSVYSLDAEGIQRISNAQMGFSGTSYAVTFAGSGHDTTYLVNSAEALLKPVFEMARPKANLDTSAQYLIISHPDFISGLQPFVEAKQAQGFTVHVVDVNDLYAQYSDGIFEPQAIKRYIAHAAHDLGTEYVLLVGADSYDYRNTLGINSVAYIPSLYTAIGLIANVPADPLFTDVNNDGLPELPIGRFPVHNLTELSRVIQKTLAFADRQDGNTATYISDQGYLNDANALAALLPANWSSQKISLDQLTLADAQAQTLAAMNNGATLVNYNGHSGTTAWTYNGLFNASMARTLTNAGRPFVVVQWSCYSTYASDPQTISLTESFLFSGEQGAAAVMGSQTQTSNYPEQIFGRLLTPLLAQPGLTLGQAITQAKFQYAQYARSVSMSSSDQMDILLAWTLMGDPALMIQR